MITLYDYLPSQNAWKIRLLLNHLKRPYTQKFVSIFEGEGQTSSYLNVNPTGAVPAIELPDGTTLAESNAILVFLAAGSKFLPADSVKHSQVLQWLFFESDYVQSSVATLRHWVLTGKASKRSHDVIESKRNASLKVLSILNKHLAESDFLTGHDYTIADMSVFAYTHLAADASLPLENYPHVSRWIDSVGAQTGFKAEVFSYDIDRYSVREL